MVPAWVWALLYLSKAVGLVLALYAFGLAINKLKDLLGIRQGADAHSVMFMMTFGPIVVFLSQIPVMVIHRLLSRIEYTAWLKTFDEPDTRRESQTQRQSLRLLLRSLWQWLEDRRRKLFHGWSESEEFPEDIYLE